MESLYPLASPIALPLSATFRFQVRRPPAKRTATSSTPSNTWPQARRNEFLSDAERAFYAILRQITPRQTVFAKVRLAELVKVENGFDSYRDEIDRKHIDFVLCDENIAPLVAIELDVANQTRDRLVDDVLAAASVPVIHVRAEHRYVMDEIHQLLLPYLRIGTLTI